MLELSYRKLRPVAFTYLALPCIVFLLTFVRTYLALPCALMLVLAVYLAVHNRPSMQQGCEGSTVFVSKRTLVAICTLMLIWAFLGGQGNMWFQTHDWTIRNAIFRDLITHPWPVIYAWKDTALSYYIGHWLVPAAIAKGVYAAFGLSIAWRVGNILLWLWTTLGLTLVVLLMYAFFGFKSPRRRFALIVIFISFSGMDIIGAVLKSALGRLLAPDTLHLEWWAFGALQFSSITTCLFWVFNQAVAPWIATMCFMQEKTARNYVLIASTALLCGPFPVLGLVILMIVKFVADFVRTLRVAKGSDKDALENATHFLRTCALAPQNLLALFGWCPIVVVYFLSNAAFAGGVHATEASSSGGPSLKLIVALLILDAGVYLALVWKENRRDPLFYGVCGLLIICPFVRVGRSFDFTMRVSIPAIFIVMLMCARVLLAERTNHHHTNVLRRSLLVACLVVGAATPAVEIYRGFYHVFTEHTVFLADDDTYSLENVKPSINFEAFGYQDTLFFKYVAPDS